MQIGYRTHHHATYFSQLKERRWANFPIFFIFSGHQAIYI